MKDKLWWGVFSIGAVLMIHNAIAGEWNEKPVMCEQKEIALDTVRSKGELPLITGVQSAKVSANRWICSCTSTYSITDICKP